MSNFSEKKEKNLKLFQQQIKKGFLSNNIEKSKLSVQIAKVSRQKIETTDQKIYNFQLTKIGKKRKVRMTTIDFISI